MDSTVARRWYGVRLGYFLLFIEGQENEAIRHSLAYHERFPAEADALFNAACGYAQLYQTELRSAGGKQIPDSSYRAKSLDLPEKAIRTDPANRAYALNYAKDDESFSSLGTDLEFRRITAEPKAA